MPWSGARGSGSAAWPAEPRREQKHTLTIECASLDRCLLGASQMALDAGETKVGEAKGRHSVSFESLPAVAPSRQSNYCSRCRSLIADDWLFCGTCGQKRGRGKAKSQQKQLPRRQQVPEPEPTDLASLPPSLVQSLNTVLRGFKHGIFNEKRAEVEHKNLLVTALELESALQMEDAYVKLQTEGKINKLAGPDFQAHSAPSQSSGFGSVCGSSIYTATASGSGLPPIQKSIPGRKKKRTKSKAPGYLDEVGSVAVFYAQLVERDKALAGLTRAVAEDSVGPQPEHVRQRRQLDFLRVQEVLLGEEEGEDVDKGGQGGRAFVVDGQTLPASSTRSYDADRRGFLLEEASEGEEEEEKEGANEVMYWGTLKEKGRYFLARDGVDVGRQVDAQRDIVGPFYAEQRRRKQRGGRGADKEGDDEEEDDEGEGAHPMTPLSWQQVLLESEQLKAMETPMLWTELVRPDPNLPLSRPLTPEPTSDDEDAEFERQLEEMQAATKRAEAAAAQVQPDATGDLGSLADGVSELGQGSEAGQGSPLQVVPLVAAGPEEEESMASELDLLDPAGADDRAAQARAEKKARIAKARRAMAFSLAYKQAAELAKPKPKLYKPRAKRRLEMDEMELRAHELSRALAASDGQQQEEETDGATGDEEEDASTLTPAPVKVRSVLPQFRAHSIIARMYKASCAVLRAAIQQAQFRLVDEYLPPPRSGRPMPFQRFGKMLAVVEEALLQAPGIDMQAKMEFAAFQEQAAKARAEPATQVADALESISSYHAQYNGRYKALMAATHSDPQALGKIVKLREKAEEDLYTRGRALQTLQALEVTVTQNIREQEFVTIETIRAWRPRHGELIGQATWCKRALQAVIYTSAAKIIQRAARLKLLFFFWGEPLEPWRDPILEKMKARKRMVYNYVPQK